MVEPREKPRPSDPRSGLCPRCRHVKIVASQKGSTFFLCLRAAEDPRYPKYPPQPVVSCRGYES
jgi:hypothetical protein